MNQFGSILLVLGGIAAVWTIIRGLQAWQQNNNTALIRQAQYGIYTMFFTISTAVVILVYQLMTSNFVNKYVASYTSEALPTYYKFSALWAGQAGSLLFWLWLIAAFSALFVWRHKDDYRELMSIMLPTFAFTSLLFFGLTIFVTSPFETLNFMPRDGNGLNPLLQNWGMSIHPPLLYLGYVGWTIPFGFLIAALVTKNLDSNWLKQARPWTITAWLFLALGNLIGAQWAYVELGWGGYWAWDPVENASLMPWLLATAFVHSQIMQERRGIFKFWNVSLLLITFAMTIFGTYLTRSGVLQSVHAFGDTEMGPYFLAFLGIVIFGGFGLIFARRNYLDSRSSVQTPLSREGTVLLSNIAFSAMTFTVLWGTMYPLTSRIFFGEQRTVEISYFNSLNVPLGIFVLLLTGIGPLIAWRKASSSNFVRHFSIPTAFGVATVVLLALFGITALYPLVTFGLAAFTLAGIIQEFYKGTVATMQRTGENWLKSFGTLVMNTKRRYGGYLIHIGIVMIFIGITGSSAFNTEAEAKLARGESMEIENYVLTYSEFVENQNALKYSGIAVLDIEKNGKYVGQIRPEKAKFYKSDQPMSEVALRMTLEEDLYVILGGFDKERNVWVTARVNPLINWMWLGGIMLIIGTVVALFPETDSKKRTHTRKRLQDIDAETIIRELSEIEIDYAEGKIDDTTYKEEYEPYEHVDAWIKRAANAKAEQHKNGNGKADVATAEAVEAQFCHTCGTQLPRGSRFCSNCGERVNT
ncbi:MAG: cytochrome c biogenesis protein CcsA [Candidatus Marinimicrobia bacterium]|nr:cytochrome c biogenesis protein CcsA [Candidatus Neomarinimicrobiota bacterium]MCF7827832.1 cytochrome c biogenesis protein CcsA [Candidatus Neomarinimicrobiota bacterium]MCF7879413.1 cytochrome c biogenesis protein CcsA [Candidatus Neomarinimicrobiota bacterium]